MYVPKVHDAGGANVPRESAEAEWPMVHAEVEGKGVQEPGRWVEVDCNIPWLEVESWAPYAQEEKAPSRSQMVPCY